MRCGTFFDIPKHCRMNCIYLGLLSVFALCLTQSCSLRLSVWLLIYAVRTATIAPPTMRMRRRRARDGSQSLDPGSRVSGFVFFPRTDLVVRPGQTTVPDPSRAHVGGSSPRRRESFELCRRKSAGLRRALHDNYNPPAFPSSIEGFTDCHRRDGAVLHALAGAKRAG